MDLIALLSGVVICFITFWKNIDVFLTVLIFLPFRNRKSFYTIYDSVRDEEGYEMFGRHRSDSYSEYLKLHEAIKSDDHAYKRFMAYNSNSTRFVFMILMPIMFLPSILFWDRWYWYVVGNIFTILSFVLYKKLVMNIGINFYKTGLIFIIMNEFLKDVIRHKIR